MNKKKKKQRSEKIRNFRQEFLEENQLSYSFRPGFSDRVLARLGNLEAENYSELFYKNLSGFLPKMLSFSFLILFLLIVTLYMVNGNINPANIIGADKVDEFNFISYLFLETK